MAQISTEDAVIVIRERARQVQNAVKPHGCGKCDTLWGGANTSHCSECHRTFTGLTAFDKHRDGSHARGTRHCVEPHKIGPIDAGRDYLCWGLPGNDSRFAE